MSELRRLSDDPSLGDVERAVLRSASSDRAGASARLAAQAAIGLGVGSALMASSGAASAATATTSKLAGWAAAMKIGAALAITGSVAYVSAPMVMPREAAPARTLAAAPAPAPVVVSAPVPARADEPAISVDALPSAAPLLAKDTPRHVRASAARRVAVAIDNATNEGETATAAASRLGEEVAQIEAARSKLAAHDGAAALAALDAYGSAFPQGAFQPEAAAMRSDAHVATGDQAAARVAAKRYLERWPSGGAAVRLRALVGASPRDQNEAPRP